MNNRQTVSEQKRRFEAIIANELTYGRYIHFHKWNDAIVERASRRAYKDIYDLYYRPSREKVCIAQDLAVNLCKMAIRHEWSITCYGYEGNSHTFSFLAVLKIGQDLVGLMVTKNNVHVYALP